MRSKSQTISTVLRQEIRSGKFDVAHKMPSERALMRRFAVARATIQAAIRDLLNDKLVVRRPGYGTYLATAASQRATRTLAVIFPDGYYPFYMRILRGIEQAAQGRGWRILSASLGAGDVRERAIRAAEFAEICVREQVSGVIFQPLQFLKDGEKINRQILAVFKRNSIPVVLVDSDILTPPSRSEYDLVGIDNIRVGYELARHLIGRGAKRLVYISNPMPAPTSLKRGQGVAIAVSEANLKWSKESVFFADANDVRRARALFKSRNRPDAIVASNDYVAKQLVSTLAAIGIRIPQDCWLTGVNGDPCATECVPPLTTAIQPCEEIGQAAVNLLLWRMENPAAPLQEVLLGATIVERESTLNPNSLKPTKRRKS